MSNKIEKSIEIKASVSKVWDALTDHHEFGNWFGVKLHNPFALGQTTQGQLTYPGYEHLQWAVVVQEMTPREIFSFTWHPYAVDPEVDYAKEEPTLVEFKLEEIPIGTRLTVIESRFDKIPAARRSEALRMNEKGWSAQMENIKKYLTLAS